MVGQLKRHWLVAVSTEPSSREAANEAVGIVRHVLSIIPVKEPVAGPERPSTGRA